MMARSVLVTGAGGFIGANLVLRLTARSDIQVLPVRKFEDLDAAIDRLGDDGIVFHLAGVNRPRDLSEFSIGNSSLTGQLLDRLEAKKVTPRLVFSSSTQAATETPYGVSKAQAERLIRSYAERTRSEAVIYRLPNTFGKWARPNYNSVVATFCYNIANHIPIRIDDPDAALSLLYIDDLIDAWMRLVEGQPFLLDAAGFGLVPSTYRTTVGELATSIRAIEASRRSLVTERVGQGLERALHATYLSYLAPTQFAYPLTVHDDPRGEFAEVLKTKDSGQFSFFTARPGVTRGGHYHNSKTEKFLVVRGKAIFRFRHMQTGDTYEIATSDTRYEIVETVPGWTHDITNVGEQDLIALLWANEIFDPEKPDTYQEPLGNVSR
jgi:UDP-2-acetamido-2,6-beta-L-arabino-hexul-4-ose reductase